MKASIQKSVTGRLGGLVSRGIKAAALNDEGHLVFTLTDNSSIDLGQVVAEEGLHAATHAAEGVDALTPAAIGAAAADHGHGTDDVEGLNAALSGKAAADHGHGMSEIEGLDAALAGKQASLGANSVSAAMLAANAVSQTYTGTLTTTWNTDNETDVHYRQQIPIAGLTAADHPIVDVVLTRNALATADAEREEWAKIYSVTAYDGVLEVLATEPTTAALNLQILVVKK